MKFVWPKLNPIRRKPPVEALVGKRSPPPATKPAAVKAPAGKDEFATESASRQAVGDPRVVELTGQLLGLVSSIRINRNERTLLSLRGSRTEGIRLSLHHGLLDHPAALAELPAWIRGRGRVPGPALKAAIDTVFMTLAKKRRGHPQTAPVFEPLAGPVDLEALYATIHGQWFPQLTRPPVFWGPRLKPMRRRHIRFAAYHRKPHPRIIVNRLLDQPWIAREFVAYVLYHELCHHAQACNPVRGELPHSPRFKEWEARYPRFAELRLWEKAHLDRFLGLPE